MDTDSPNLGFRSLHNLEFKFNGVFQCRLATDSDASTEPRGNLGWTFAYCDGFSPDAELSNLSHTKDHG